MFLQGRSILLQGVLTHLMQGVLMEFRRRGWDKREEDYW